jgi:small-conductance mechanosensitive channel
VRRRPLIADNVELFEKRGTRYLRWAVGLLWLFATARLFRIDAPSWDAVQGAVSWRARMGSLDLSLGDVLAFAITLWIAVLLGRLVGFVLSEGLKTRGLGRGVHTAISRTATYAVVAAGTVIAVLALGTELTRVTVLVGTLGVGIGFGLQDVVNNFVSGLLLLYERPGAGGGRHRGGGRIGNRDADRDPLEHGGHRAGLRSGGPQRAPHLQRGDQLDALRQTAPD